MKRNLLPFFIFFSISAFSQLYTYSPDKLPLNGATGQSMDVQAADIDGDGDLDLVLANEFQRNVLLRNDGTGNFTNGSNIPLVIHDSEDVAIADYDSDGDLDLIFCSEDDQIHEYYLNDGTGDFTAHPSFQFPNSVANAVITAYINNDTFPDVIFGNAGQNRLFINSGTGTFIEETSERLPVSNNTTQDLVLSDIDMDGDLDLMVGNEGGSKVLINTGDGIFEDQTSERLPINALVETRKISTGDINGDGAPDLFFSNVAFLQTSGPYRSNLLFLNDGAGIFTDVSDNQLPGDNEDTLDAIFEDVDMDGDNDLVIANVNLQSVANQKVLLNDGTGTFEDQTIDVLGALYFENPLGVIAADLNNDGLRDLYFCERNTGNASLKDLFFIKNLTDAANELNVTSQAEITIAPNPARAFFTVSANFPVALDWTMELRDSSGKIIQVLDYEIRDTNQFYVQLSNQNLSSGTYFLHLKNTDTELIKKVQIIR